MSATANFAAAFTESSDFDRICFPVAISNFFHTFLKKVLESAIDLGPFAGIEAIASPIGLTGFVVVTDGIGV